MGNSPDTQGLPIEMAKVFSITPFNFPCSLLPSDGSVDTSYFIQLSKEELIWVMWKVKDFSITSATFSGWPSDAYITSGSLDAFSVPRIGYPYPLDGVSSDFISERYIQFAATFFEAESSVTPDPLPNPYGFPNFYFCHVKFAPDSRHEPIFSINIYRDLVNDCYWMRPPSLELGAYVQFGGNPVVVHASSSPSETASRTHVGNLDIVLFGRTTTVPLISTPADPGSFEITWPSGATASVSMEVGTLYPYSTDMNDF